MWRLAVLVLLGCKGDAPPSQPPQPPQPAVNTLRIALASSTPPALVAMRADDGTDDRWRTLTLRDEGYDVPVASRFTLVVVCAHWLGSYVEVRHWTAADPRDFAVACVGFDGEPLADMHPTFAAGDEIQTVKTGGIHETCSNNVPDCRLRYGTHDAIAIHGTTFDTVRAKIIRDLRIFDGARFDADASRGWKPDRRTIEVVSEFRGRNNSVYICLETRRGEDLLCSGETYWGPFPERVEREYIRVPSSARLDTDCDVLEVMSTRMCLVDAPRTRVEIPTRDVPAMHYDRGARSLAFSLADAAALNITVRHPARQSPRWNLIATRNWLADATRYRVPGLDTIPGWRAEWSLAAGEIIDASLIWGPKPSANLPNARLWQRLVPGDRIDTAAGRVENAEIQ